MLISNKTMEDEDGEEIVTYDRKLTFLIFSRHGRFKNDISASTFGCMACMVQSIYQTMHPSSI